MKLDMHFHSTLSDGRKNSSEIIKKAKEKGLEFVSCTDHDIINKDFSLLAKSACINTCEAVEISVCDIDRHFHFTSYAQVFSSEIIEVLENTIDGRKRKINKQIELLQKNGFKIDLIEFYEFYKEKTNIDNLNISHIAWYLYRFEENIALVKRLTGEDLSREDFLIRCLKTEGDFGYIGSVVIPEYEPSLQLIGKLTKENNAILSFAHPNFKLTQDEFKSKIEYYLSLGVNAVEINSRATESWVKLILEFQQKYNYIITFGSDCHFKSYAEDEHGELGFSNPYVSEEVILENFKRFKEKIS